MPSTTVSIPGIHCSSCAALIKDVSAKFPAIKNVDIDVTTKKVSIEHGGDFDFARWKQKIEELGNTYKVADVSW